MRTTVKVVVAVALAAIIAVGASAALDAPSRSLTTTTLVNAPREEVWRLLLDFDGYAEWNPYMRIDGSPTLGGRIDVRVGAQGDANELDATIYVLKPPRKLRWQSRLLLPGLMDVEYEIIVAPVSPRLTQVIQHVRDEGVLVPLTAQVPTRHGLEIMGAALARTAEAHT